MGHYCSKKASSDHIQDYISAINLKKPELLKHDPAYPLNCEVLKTLTQDILYKYKEGGHLQDYTGLLFKFTNKYDYSKFVPFLADLSVFTLGEKAVPMMKNPKHSRDYLIRRSATTGSISTKDLSMHYENSTFFRTHLHTMPSERVSSIKPFSQEKVFEFFQHAIVQQDNYFFELTKFIGDIYAKKYINQVKEFQNLLHDVSQSENEVIQEYKFDKKTKENIEIVFENAKKDIQQFESLLYNCMKVFLMQISVRSTGNESLVPTDSSLDHLALKLLFGKNKCYQTFFILIRYYTFEDEIRLKNSFKKLKATRPDRFGVDSEFCLENNDAPYESVIEAIDYLDLYHNPYDKFKLIFQLRKQIIKAIDHYRQQENLDTKNIAMTGDHLLPLYTYCLALSANEKLRAHQLFVETFLDDETLVFNEEGYCFSTFSGAIDSLVSRKDVRESLKDTQRRLSGYSKASMNNNDNESLHS